MPDSFEVALRTDSEMDFESDLPLPLPVPVSPRPVAPKRPNCLPVPASGMSSEAEVLPETRPQQKRAIDIIYIII